jgi:intracellular multiplication protein IcmT
MSISIWRNASLTPKLAGLPCTAYLPIFVWMFHMRWWTFYAALGCIVAFGLLAKFGLTFPVLWRKLLSLLRGQCVYARPWWYRNRFRDRV